MHINCKYVVVIFLILFTCFSCEKNEEKSANLRQYVNFINKMPCMY